MRWNFRYASSFRSVSQFTAVLYVVAFPRRAEWRGYFLYRQQSARFPAAVTESPDFDQTHVFLVNYSYRFPASSTKQELENVIGGWTLSGQAVAQSGMPYSVYDYSGSVGSLYYGGDVYIANPILPLKPGVTVQQAELQPGTLGLNAGKPVLNAADFFPQFVQPGTNGVPACNASGCDSYESLFSGTGRNIFRGPFQTRFDMGVGKQFLIHDKYRLRFDATAFNVFNHPDFDAPNNDVTYLCRFRRPAARDSGRQPRLYPAHTRQFALPAAGVAPDLLTDDNQAKKGAATMAAPFYCPRALVMRPEASRRPAAPHCAMPTSSTIRAAVAASSLPSRTSTIKTRAVSRPVLAHQAVLRSRQRAVTRQSIQFRTKIARRTCSRQYREIFLRGNCLLHDHRAGGFHAAIQIHRSKNRLESVHQQSLLGTAARGLFAASQMKIAAKIQTMRGSQQVSRANQMIFEEGELTFGEIRKTGEQPLAHQPAEYGIAQELQAFIVRACPDVRHRRELLSACSATSTFVGAGAMGEGAIEKRAVPECVAKRSVPVRPDSASSLVVRRDRRASHCLSAVAAYCDCCCFFRVCARVLSLLAIPFS